MTGDLTIDEDFSTLSEEDLQKGELFFGAPAALIVLLLVFGTVVAGVIPLVLALLSIFVALALTAIVAQAFDLSVFVTNMIFGMGLALGIDYSLFILSRFREERAHGREKLDAIETAGATASRAVLFSGAAFVLAMTGLELVPNTIMRSLATGAILVGIVSVVAALTLLPAVISLLGDRIDSLRVPYFGRHDRGHGEPLLGPHRARRHAPAGRQPRRGGRPPARRAPSRSSRLDSGTAGISTLPDRFESKQGFLLLNRGVPGPDDRPGADRRRGRHRLAGRAGRASRGSRTSSARTPIFGPPRTETSPDGALVVARRSRWPATPSRPRRVAAVRELRADLVPRRSRGVGRARRSSAGRRPRTSTTTTSWTPGSRSCSPSCSGSASSCSRSPSARSSSRRPRSP